MQMYGFVFNVPNVPLSSLKILEGELPYKRGQTPFVPNATELQRIFVVLLILQFLHLSQKNEL